MRTLLIEPTQRSTAGPVADALEAAGHQVVRCHHVEGPAFPCAGLTDEGCPIEGPIPVDLAVAVRPEASAQPTAEEAGVTCAIRTGLPLVVVGPAGPTPFAPWAEACGDPEQLPSAADRAIDAIARRRAAPLRDEVLRVLAVEGVDAGEVRVEVRRDGDTAEVMVRTERPLDERVANTVATRVHAVDRTGSWPTTKLAVAVGRCD
jgi:hypothetical protein